MKALIERESKMRILLDFLNGSDDLRALVMNSAKEGSLILSDPLFLDVIEAHPGFDFCSMPSRAVRDKIENAGDVTIQVGFYKGWFWSKAIAYEEDGQVWFNTRKLGYGAGGVGNVVHEVMHALGFSHNGNAAAGNENTAPYWIGAQADTWVVKPSQAPKAEVEAVTGA